ncbi:MAG TPA: hypothetical protein VEU55_01440 [Gemmatimonadales bacterium]|nr:hypothetical protein [Gemmatimonadales bacterium]
MTLRSLVVCAIVLAVAAPAAAAQNPPPGGGPGQGGFAQRQQRLFQDITLTAEQRATIDSIRARYRAGRPTFTPGSPPDPATRRAMRERMRAQLDEIRAVLTPEQQQIWDRNVAALRERRPDGP